jgi:hypothetical protein
MCVTPYIATAKDGRKIPVPCGKCVECLKDFQNQWTFRLEQEMKNCLCPVFVTLTYNDEHLPTYYDCEDGCLRSKLVKSDLQKFMKRFRKNAGELADGCRFFAIGEYGSKYDRSHYHVVLMCPNARRTNDIRKVVEKSWHLGFSKVRYCTSTQVKYVTKYMNKLDRRPHLVKPFRTMSRGIGLRFLSDAMVNYYLTTFSRVCKTNSGHTISLPRYYRNKLDELSASNYMMKKAGVIYSELLDAPQFGNSVSAAKFNIMLKFTENYEELYKQACRIESQRCRRNNYQYFEPTPQDVWQMYSDSCDLISDLVRRSEEVLEQVCIRNKLRESDAGLSPVEINMLE